MKHDITQGYSKTIQYENNKTVFKFFISVDLFVDLNFKYKFKMYKSLLATYKYTAL